MTNSVWRHIAPLQDSTTLRRYGQAMGQALTALEMWMASNCLCLNPTKTKFMWLLPLQQLAKLDLTDISTAFPNYTFSSSVGDLGVNVILDQELSFAPHLNRLTRDCFYQLRQLRTVAHSLSTGAAATLVHSFVTNCLDYCLSLYSCLPSVRLACLDCILRYALLAKYQSSVMYQVTCWRFCIGSLSDSV